MTFILDGKSLAQELEAGYAKEVADLKATGATVRLAIITVGDDDASKVYARSKQKKAEALGIDFRAIHLDDAENTQDVLDAVYALNQDPGVSGFMLQLPLPDQFDTQAIVNAIDPMKDVDGLTAYNLGALMQGEAHFVACTPKGVMTLLKHYNIPIAGKKAVVIGRSQIVGLPLAQLLLKENATLTVIHRSTNHKQRIIESADIVISATGQIDPIDVAWIRDDAVVVDVGTNRGADGKLRGDLDLPALEGRVQALTPVPGGVGPMTIATLMEQTIQSARAHMSEEM